MKWVGPNPPPDPLDLTTRGHVDAANSGLRTYVDGTVAPLLAAARVTYRNGLTTSGTLKVYTDVMTTNATGAVTFILPSGYFSSLGYVDAVAQRDTVDPAKACFAQVRSIGVDQIAVQVFESKTTGMLLGGVAEGLELATSALVRLLVFGT